MTNSTAHRRGFSLIEVLVFISILSLFFVSAAAIVSVVLKNMKINEHKILGTRFAEEAVEWLRADKETDWNAFTARADNSGLTYCMNNLQWTAAGGTCDYSLKGLYKRTAKLTSLQTSDGYKYQVNISVQVEWAEPGRTYRIPINTTFSIWEQ